MNVHIKWRWMAEENGFPMLSLVPLKVIPPSLAKIFGSFLATFSLRYLTH